MSDAYDRAALVNCSESLLLDRSRCGPETLSDAVGVNCYKMSSLLGVF